MNTLSARWTALAAIVAALGALIHIAAIAGGPAWYAFFDAPAQVVASAREGSWLAPVSAIAIALLMGLCAAYACSALGRLRRLPLLRTALAVIAVICLLRGLILVPLAINHPQLRTPFQIIAALVWGTAGIGFALAFISVRRAR